jgi:hypothetical protein
MTPMGCGMCDECRAQMTAVTGTTYPIWNCMQCKNRGMQWPVPKSCPRCKGKGTIKHKIVQTPPFCICDVCNAKAPLAAQNIEAPTKEDLEPFIKV